MHLVKSSGILAFLAACMFTLLLALWPQDVMALAPVVSTGAAGDTGGAGAVVNGTVNGGGLSTSVWFEYGLTEEYGQSIAALPDTVSGSVPAPVTGLLLFLDRSTTYHYRVAAANGDGTSYGEDMTVTTLGSTGATPTVVTDAATVLGPDSATLNGRTNTYGITTVVMFQWGEDRSYGNTVSADQNPVTSSALVPITATLTGLTGDTTYHYRIVAANINGVSYGSDMSFALGTGGDTPTVITTAATAIGSSGATCNGTISANGAETIGIFEYGTDTGYGNVAPASPNPVSGTTATPVSVTLSNLLPNTTYHYRLAGSSSIGSANGDDETFTTLSLPPDAATDPPTAVTATGAALNATVNANGTATVVTFQYGTDSGYGTTVTADQSPVTGTVPTAVSHALSGLGTGQTYHYRVVAASSSGTVYGQDRTFTAGSVPPAATTEAAGNIGAGTATVNGTVNGNNETTTVIFEIGVDSSYGRSVSATPSTVTGATASPVLASLDSLAPGTTYHYRVVAWSNGGISYGDDTTFSTLTPPTVTTANASAVSTSGATLNGAVNGHDNTTSVTFEYGTDTSYGTTVTADQSPVTGSTTTPVSKTITGLTAGVTYHYRVVGQNSAGTTHGSDIPFTPALPVPPVVVTSAAATIMQDSAVLSGTVNAQNDDATVSFEYGTTPAYGSSIAAVPSSVSGSNTTLVTGVLSGLSPATLYFYRAVGTNTQGTTYGAMNYFNTAPAGSTPPMVTTGGATSVGATGATLNGIANANGDISTIVYFQYTPAPLTASYSFNRGALPSTISGTADIPVSSTISGLTPGTTYYYRLYASNSQLLYGYGEPMSFTTLAADTPPTAVTNAATGVGTGSAIVNGTVNAGNSSATVTFEYGESIAYDRQVTADQSPVSGSSDTAVSGTLSDLTANTTYHYRVKTENTGNSVTGADMTFTTSGTAPVASTNAASSVSGTGATLHGLVNGANDSTTVTFQYGTTTGYGSTATADQSPVSGTSTTPVSSSISGLTNNTTYHYRVVAQNSSGTTYGSDMSFFTGAQAPVATTITATDIGRYGATLNGLVDANNTDTTVTFEYGLSTAYGRQESANQSPVTGSSPSPVSVALTDLQPDTTYHYRVVAQNSSGTTSGQDMTFLTVAHPPLVTTLPATDIVHNGAILNGLVDANSSETTVTFEYGLSTAYGQQQSAAQSPVPGSSITPVPVSLPLTGLQSNTTYHYRVVGQSGSGIIYGADSTFTTLRPRTNLLYFVVLSLWRHNVEAAAESKLDQAAPKGE